MGRRVGHTFLSAVISGGKSAGGARYTSVIGGAGVALFNAESQRRGGAEGRRVRKNCWRMRGLGNCFGDSFFHFGEASRGDLQGVLLPVFGVEELEREGAGEAGGEEIAEERSERGDAIAGINAVGVLDHVAGWISRKVVHMKA